VSAWPHGLVLKPIVDWPGGLTPPHRRRYSQFGASMSSTLETLRRELGELGAKNVVMQIALREQDFRIDGYPRANSRPEHPGVILSMDTQHGPLSYPCDTFTDWHDNLRAIALALEALRKVDRYGVTRRGEQYAGFKAIGSGIAMPAQMTADEAMRVLLAAAGVDEVDERTFRLAQRSTHPDYDGTAEEFDRVMQAGRVLGLTS
jgi:hypothetical protein